MSFHRRSALWLQPPRRLAVFRALQLGDMLCSVPALRALRHALPDTEITLIGLPGAAGFVERFHRYLDDLLVFPGLPGMPEQIARESALPDFYEAARARRFDVAIQMHGSGTLTNPVVAQLGARACAGFVAAEAMPAPVPAAAPASLADSAGSPDTRPLNPFAYDPLFMPWPDRLPEVLRYTALMHHLGIEVPGTDLEFPLSAGDHDSATALLQQRGLNPRETILVHPGARLPSRRWPGQGFAHVARQLAAQGWQIALTGSEDERPITARVRDAMPEVPVADLTGATSLGTLAALVAQCRLVVCNDTGISHVAAAVHTPSVVVASGSDVKRWAPLNHRLHTVLWQDAPCRPCAHHECPLPGHPCATGVPPQDVARCAEKKLTPRGLHA